MSSLPPPPPHPPPPPPPPPPLQLIQPAEPPISQQNQTAQSIIQPSSRPSNQPLGQPTSETTGHSSIQSPSTQLIDQPNISQPLGLLGDPTRNCLRADPQPDLTRSGSSQVFHANQELIEEWLAEGIWKAEIGAHILERADEEGLVIELLKTVQLPLEQYPQIAQSYVSDVLEEFNLADVTERGANFRTRINCKIRARSVRDEPHPLANLLANVTRVPHALADSIMKDLTEEMIISQVQAVRTVSTGTTAAKYTSSTASTEDNSGKKVQQLQPILNVVPAAPGFPKTLGPIYIQRRATITQGSRACIKYDAIKRTLILDETGHEYATSPEFGISLPAAQRRGALIPQKADTYAYVHYGPNLENGGYLYCKEGQLVAVNQLYLKMPQRYSLVFEDYEVLSEEAAMKLRRDNRTQAVSVEAFLAVGAREYAFIGPNEGLAGNCKRPGFAFLFNNAKDHRFFPIKHAAEVLNRAHIRNDMNCCVLKRKEQCERILQKLHLTGARKNSKIGEPVRIARLKCPDVLHPVVLHALARTSRDGVIATDAARAIARAAFRKFRPWIIFDVLIELTSFISLISVTDVVRTSEAGICPSVWEDISLRIPFFTLSFAWLKYVFHELCLFLGLFRWYWEREFLCWTNFSVGCILGIKLVLLSWLFVGSGDCDRLRPLLALLSVAIWFSICYFLRGFEFFRIGLRILPMFEAMKEVFDFILVSLLFFVAMYVAGYILSDKPMMDVVWSTYKLGLLGEVDRDTDVLLLEEEGDDPKPDWWQVFQYMSFAIFSFIVTVAIMNIFIGVMSNAFDFHQMHARTLFTRAQMQVGLEYSLVHETKRLYCQCRSRPSQKTCKVASEDSEQEQEAEENALWFCVQDNDDTQASNTIREAVSEVKDDLMNKLVALEELIKREDGHVEEVLAQQTPCN